MSEEDLQTDIAFRSSFVADDVFLFAFHCSIKEGEAVFRRFNRVGGFIE